MIESLPANLSGLPYVDQYFGVWSMAEDHFNALRGHAQQINVQLHLDKTQAADQQASLSARGSTDVHVTRDRIAVIEIRGTMMKQASSFSGGASTVAVRRQVRAAAADDDVAGILLLIDSPGGTIAGTDDLAADVAAAAAQKPTQAFIEDLGASAAYWVASQANQVFANKTAVVGSIGVFMVVYDVSLAAEKEGLEVHVVKFGEFKAGGVAGTKISAEHLTNMQRLVDASGDHFVNAIASGRNMTRAQAKQIADGRAHPASAALELKLLDGIQSVDDTMAKLIAATQQPPQNGRTRAMAKEPAKPQAAETVELVSGELLTSTASLADLKEALPDASNDFLVAQLENSATLEQASQAYVKQLAAENAKLKETAAQREKEAAEAKAKTQAKGNEPLNDAGESASAGGNTAREQVAELVTERRQAHGSESHLQATTAVLKKNPALRQALIDEANQQ